MKAIVGLGNPGAAYRGTRHNVGFEVVDRLALRWSDRLRPWKAVADLAVVGDRRVVLAEPQTFMNESGAAVERILAFHKIEPADLLVVVDEVQLPLGRLRLRPSGSAGGHNGLKSVIQRIGTGFPRLRIGIGRGDPRWDLSDYVLARFKPEERSVADEVVDRAVDAVEAFVSDGIGAAMNRFNVREDAGSEEDVR
jgi:PTH1 family peptidyl-tRNA hydrolase